MESIVQSWCNDILESDDPDQPAIDLDFLSASTAKFLFCGGVIQITLPEAVNESIIICGDGDTPSRNVSKNVSDKIAQCEKEYNSAFRNVLETLSFFMDAAMEEINCPDEDIDGASDDSDDDEQNYSYEDDDGNDMAVKGESNCIDQEWLAIRDQKKRWVEKIDSLCEDLEKRKSDLEVYFGRAGLSESQPTKDVGFSPEASSQVLIADALSLIDSAQGNGYSIEVVDDNIFRWKVKMHQFDPDSNLSLDLTMLDHQYGYAHFFRLFFHLFFLYVIWCFLHSVVVSVM